MLFLASQSPRRRQLLRRLRRPFRVVRSMHREFIQSRRSPSENATANAKGKVLRAVLPRATSQGLVIGADTFLYFQGRIIGKPRSLRHARQLLGQLSGRSHWVYTGLCVRDVATGQLRTSVEKTRVTFKRLRPETIDRLVMQGAPLDKAGGYALQEDRGELIARITGSRTNVIGLPLELLHRELRALAISCNDCC